MPKGRVFNISQYENHPKTGEQLLTEEQILNALKSYKTIKQWAYIKHDKDIVTEEEERKQTSFGLKAGDKKPPHFHIVLNTENNYMDVEVIANWLGIPSNFIDLPKGRGAFLDCIEYLTHEEERQQAKGKYLYPDDEVHANFDFRAELQRRADKRLKYGKDLSLKDQVRYDVLYNGMTLLDAMEFDKYNYMADYKELQRLRMEYINQLDPPPTRMNFYVEGKGGVGKGLLSRALGKYLAKTFNPEITEVDEMIFEVGAENSTFEGYDGQPVIIWHDKRAYELLQVLGGRGNVFTVFDTHPTKQRQNVKYSSVNLSNTFNIVNSVQSYSNFLDGLAGEYKDKDGEIHHVEDKGQAYRRFPLIIPIQEEYFTLLGNKGFFENTSEFEVLTHYGDIIANFQELERHLQNKPKLKERYEHQALSPVLSLTSKGLNAANQSDLTDEEIDKKFKHFGKNNDYRGLYEMGFKIIDKTEDDE